MQRSGNIIWSGRGGIYITKEGDYQTARFARVRMDLSSSSQNWPPFQRWRVEANSTVLTRCASRIWVATPFVIQFSQLLRSHCASPVKLAIWPAMNTTVTSATAREHPFLTPQSTSSMTAFSLPQPARSAENTGTRRNKPYPCNAYL